MKKIILVIATIAIYACKSTKSISVNPLRIVNDSILKIESFNGDTTAYLNALVAQKNRYIGKPLSYLISELDFKVNQVTPHPGINKTKSSPYIYIYIYI